MHQSGVTSTADNVAGTTPTTSSPVSHVKGGKIFASSQMEEAFFQHNVVPRLEPTEQALVRSQRPFLLSPGVPVRRGSMHSASVCSCCAGFGVLSPCRPLSAGVLQPCAGFGVLSPCRPLSAGVASHLTLVAITGQLVRFQGCSDVEATRSRVAQPECVERLVPGSPPICVCRILTFFQAFRWTIVALGWWQMAYRCSTGHSWPWTPRWSAQSGQTVVQEGSAPPQTEQPSRKLAAGRNSDTLNSLVNKVAPDLWCWRVRLGDVGLRKRKTF